MEATITNEEHAELLRLINGMSDAAEANDRAGVHGRALNAVGVLNRISARYNETLPA